MVNITRRSTWRIFTNWQVLSSMYLLNVSEDAISLSRTSSVDATMTNNLYLIVLQPFCSGGGDET